MSLLKKIVAIATIAGSLLMMAGPAMGATIAELEAQIADLLATLATLQAELAALKGEVTIEGCEITSFDRNLSQGMSGDDVKCLQIILNSDPDTQLAESGVGSPGEETNYFGPLTKAAVIKFQEKYADEVLASWGLTTGTGFVGTTTRAKLNELLAPAEEEEEEEEEEEVPTPAAGLSVTLAADTPAAGSIPSGATTDGTSGNANFTKFTLAASDEGDVSISKLYVTRTGLASNSDVENIKIIDADTGVYTGSIGSLNVDNRAMITFVPNLVISAGESKDYYIRAGIVAGTAGGKTVALGIASASDITSDASEVTGAFPITGNMMTTVAIDIGSADVSEETTVDSQPDIGDTDVQVLAFKVEAGSTEAITIEQITVMEAGTAALDDTENIELYSVTDSKSLGTVSSWNSEGKASWSDLDIVVGKGETHRFKVMLDVVGGSGLTVNADLIDGTDVLMSVKGNTYDFYITPDGGTWDGKGTDQNIQEGSLNVSKSAATPATGNIAIADNQELVTFDFDAEGEEVKVSALTLTFPTVNDYAEVTGSEFDYNDITNVKVYDEDGDIVCGPKDLASGNTVAFTDTFIVPVGVHQYTVKAKIGTDAATYDTVQAGIANPSSDITAKGMTTNESIDPTPSTEVNGNIQTVAAGALTATTLTQPEASSIAAGTNDFVWMTASLDAGTSGEDVYVTALVIEDSLSIGGSASATPDAGTIDNAEIWADLTTANSARGDIYETKVSDTEQPDDTDATTTTDETHSFSLSQTITVPKGSFVKIAFVADLAAGATATHQHTISLDEASGAVTATGADTGNSIPVTPTGSGQTMTVADKGDLTVTKDASSPVADIVLGEDTVTLAVFRLAADEVEDLDLDSIYITVTGGNYVDTYYFYSSSRSDGVSTDTPIQTAVGGTTAYVAVSDGTVTIPAESHVELTVKGLLNYVSYEYSLDNDGSIQVGFDGSTYIVESTGLSSGDECNSNESVAGNTMVAFESRPTFAVNSASPSGDLIPSANTLLAIFDITADSAEDITFDGADNNVLTVNVSTSVNTSDGNDETITLKDEEGNTLDTLEQDIATSTMLFDFITDSTTNSLTIPAGGTKKVYIYGDTTELSTDGDTIQLWLDDDLGDNNDAFGWGIDGDGNYSHAEIIFRGDILGGSLVNPS